MNTEINEWKHAAMKCGLYRGDADVSTPEKWTSAQATAACAIMDKVESLLTALENVPIHRINESPEYFIERFKVWYRETRNPALTKAIATTVYLIFKAAEVAMNP